MSYENQPPGGGYGSGGQGGYPPPPGGYGQPGGYVEPPNNHLAMAIVTTFLCCSPLGAPAIYYAGKVNAKVENGDYQGALEASANAKKWWIIALAVGIGVYLLVGIFYAVTLSTLISNLPNQTPGY
jgi:hypothetical protein